MANSPSSGPQQQHPSSAIYGVSNGPHQLQPAGRGAEVITPPPAAYPTPPTLLNTLSSFGPGSVHATSAAGVSGPRRVLIDGSNFINNNAGGVGNVGSGGPSATS